MLRKIIGIVLGILLLAGAFYFAQSLISGNERPRREIPPTVKSVYTTPVLNGEVPVSINANGNLVASDRIELFSEVQGVLQPANKSFKAGQRFQKGEVLLRIDSREFYTSLLAQRSGLYDRIAAMMPDLKFDYPDAYVRWNKYLKEFDMETSTKVLPEPATDKERYFITGQQIVTTYYNIKNLEERLSKYQIVAPFSGVLTESLVNAGALIRSGQKLGEFVSIDDFELEVSINQEYVSALQKGKSVVLRNLTGNKQWTGIVKRINGKIDQETQTVTVYIAVKGADLMEGMYLQAQVSAEAEQNALEIERSLLINEKELFVVEDNKLVVREIRPLHYTENTAIISGLQNGEQLIIRPVAGGYPGMPVKMIAESSSDK